MHPGRMRGIAGPMPLPRDLLSEIVASLELRSSLYFRAEFSAPFAVAVPADAQRIRFHVAGPGRSWVGLPSGESTYYEEGDLVLVPHGGAHVLASGPDAAPAPLHQVVAASPPDAAGVLRHGAGGDTAVLVCGHFEFDEALVHPLVESLPPLLHLPAPEGGGAGFGWMAPLVESIDRESRSGEPAGDAVAVRLSEILFIQVLRAHLGQGAGALPLTRDAQLGRALESIHADPGADWSLDELASVAGMSRTLFADRFREKIGVTPMRYLTDWRMRRARKLLADPGLNAGEVGRRVGYASEAAFSRVFRQSVGETPGRYRRSLAVH